MKAQPTKSPSQLPLEFGLHSSTTREDLAESASNAMAVSMIDAWPDWPGHLAVIVGPEGSGKTHIAEAWIANAGGKSYPANALERNLADLTEALKRGENLVLENIVPGSFAETNLFHLINSLRQEQRFCLITSQTYPVDWAVTLPDLKSRLKTAQVVELMKPDDFLLKQVIFKLFADRQLQVEEGVVDYCILRMERSLSAAEALVRGIDAEALSRKSGVTKHIASRVLENLALD